MNTQIPETGFMRLSEIIACGKRRKGGAALIPCGRTRWYEGVKAGEFPRPVRFGRMSFWRAQDIRETIARIGGDQAAV